MKKFVFSLEALYAMKENTEKLQKIQLRTIQTELDELLVEIDLLNRDYDDAKEDFIKTVNSGVEASHATNYDIYFLKIRSAIAIIEDKRRHLEQEKEKCLAELVETRKEKTMLEKLKQKEYQEYLSGVKKKQEIAVEDFLSYKTSVS